MFGMSRFSGTLLANLVTGAGFGLLLAGFSLVSGHPITVANGALWGAAGWLAVHMLPAIGLPPELPGTAAADLTLRQYWWVGAAATTAAGLALLAFGGQWWLRLLGVLLLPLPHLLGAPQPEIHESLAPATLSEHFIYVSLLANALFWAALGLISAWLFNRGQRVN